MLFQKILALLLSLISGVASLFGVTMKDAYEPDAFPIISVEEKAPDAIRIASFNVRCADVNGTPAILRRQLVQEEILRIAPDSIGVQEATTDWMAYLRLIPGYGAFGEGRDGGISGEHSAILYNRSKYRLMAGDTFWLNETKSKKQIGWDAALNRICTWVVLENRETGAQYAHVNTHFDHAGAQARLESAKLILAFIRDNFADLPVILTGDLNVEQSSEAYQLFAGNLTDARENAPDSRTVGSFHDGNAGLYPYDLDYIFCGAKVSPLVFRTVTDGVNGRYVSDHFPIYADVTMEPVTGVFQKTVS